jgi:hypothetical protein
MLRPGLGDRWPRGGGGGQKGFHEGVLELKDLLEVLAAVLVGLREHIVFDEVEDDLPEVGTAVNTPGVEDRLRQRSELVKGVDAESVEQFRSRNVPGTPHARGVPFLEFLHRVIQPEPDEFVSLSVEARVFLADERDHLAEIRSFHSSRPNWHTGRWGAIPHRANFGRETPVVLNRLALRDRQ